MNSYLTSQCLFLPIATYVPATPAVSATASSPSPSVHHASPHLCFHRDLPPTHRCDKLCYDGHHLSLPALGSSDKLVSWNDRYALGFFETGTWTYMLDQVNASHVNGRPWSPSPTCGPDWWGQDVRLAVKTWSIDRSYNSGPATPMMLRWHALTAWRRRRC